MGRKMRVRGFQAVHTPYLLPRLVLSTIMTPPRCPANSATCMFRRVRLSCHTPKCPSVLLKYAEPSQRPQYHGPALRFARTGRVGKIVSQTSFTKATSCAMECRRSRKPTPRPGPRPIPEEGMRKQRSSSSKKKKCWSAGAQMIFLERVDLHHAM